MDNNNQTEEQKAFQALTQSTEYVSTATYESVAASLYGEFQSLLTFGLLRLILQKVPEPEKFLNNIKESWKTRCQGYLGSEQKRFEELMIKAATTENKDRKLPDSLSNILNNYNMVLVSAMENVETSVNELINKLLQKETKQEEVKQ